MKSSFALLYLSVLCRSFSFDLVQKPGLGNKFLGLSEEDDGTVGFCHPKYGVWTPWHDRDDPGGTGDWEVRDFYRPEGTCAENGNPLAIQARLAGNKKSFRSSGEVLSVDLDDGLICRNRDQSDSVCENYEVRYCCSRASSCLDIYRKNESSPDGVYKIYSPYVDKPFSVFCDMKRGGWMVIQKRLDGSQDFYKTWKEYVAGFGNKNSEYWLGLDTIHNLTTGVDVALRVDLEKQNGDTGHAEYETFVVDSFSTNYRLTVGGYSGNAGDALSFHDQQAFSTKDHENDVHPVESHNCAVSYRGAWWFKDCHQSHLNARYGNFSKGYGIDWAGPFGPHYFSAKRAEMKIKAKV